VVLSPGRKQWDLGEGTGTPITRLEFFTSRQAETVLYKGEGPLRGHSGKYLQNEPLRSGPKKKREKRRKEECFDRKNRILPLR